MTAVDRTALLDLHADDIAAMSVWIARRFHRDPADVRQDLAVVLLAEGHTFDAEAVGFRLWLYRQWFRRHARRVNRECEWAEDAPEQLSKEPDPADVAEVEDTRMAVRAAVEALPVREAGLILDWFGLNGVERTSAEIAVGLGVSSERARQIAAAGLGRLRAEMTR